MRHPLMPGIPSPAMITLWVVTISYQPNSPRSLQWEQIFGGIKVPLGLRPYSLKRDYDAVAFPDLQYGESPLKALPNLSPYKRRRRWADGPDNPLSLSICCVYTTINAPTIHRSAQRRRLWKTHPTSLAGLRSLAEHGEEKSVARMLRQGRYFVRRMRFVVPPLFCPFDFALAGKNDDEFTPCSAPSASITKSNLTSLRMVRKVTGRRCRREVL